MARFFNALFYLEKPNGDLWHLSLPHGLRFSLDPFDMGGFVPPQISAGGQSVMRGDTDVMGT